MNNATETYIYIVKQTVDREECVRGLYWHLVDAIKARDYLEKESRDSYSDIYTAVVQTSFDLSVIEGEGGIQYVSLGEN